MMIMSHLMMIMVLMMIMMINQQRPIYYQRWPYLKPGPLPKILIDIFVSLTVKQIAKIVETHKLKEIKNSPQHKIG